ncbi:dihydroorotase [Salsuginibacillus halophilus]|uniref:Dihydroorotase n=1 Tax=Salsuginibacillus halophilus TaxID=517424 RepID=A0A2P8HXP2_9BACI|nr:allantoinase AllB [Salsuginibacillus halophilus]PSL50977.1 dihydroorotase [Salsuginibacillus halophilus]
MYDLAVKYGTIVTPDAAYIGNVYSKDGVIQAVTSVEVEEPALEMIDATGQYVLPGVIDTHVHSRDPGPTHKEDFFHSTQAAAAGGVTTLFEMPNTNPPVSDQKNFEKQKAHLEAQAVIDFGLWGIYLGGFNEGELERLGETGIIGFKHFWGYALNRDTYQLVYDYDPKDPNVFMPAHEGQIYSAMQTIAKTGRLLAVHAENHHLIQEETAKIKQAGGSTYEDLLQARPHLAETLTVQTGLQLAERAGVHFHVLHVSAGESVEMIRKAQQRGQRVTVETCPHYLFLSAEDYETVGPRMKIFPPVKYKSDQAKIWGGIADGTISNVCSDHAPHTREEKEGDLWSIPAGSTGVETMLPLMLNAVNEGKLSLEQVVQLLSAGPAELYEIDHQKGKIQAGLDADLVVVDMEQTCVIDENELHSKSKMSAYHGFNVQGMPVHTIAKGRVVMSNAQVTTETNGSLVSPKT